ncbi:MAG: type II toxin-antitoxin system VapC family toxin [Gemmatimonadota bacterium]
MSDAAALRGVLTSAIRVHVDASVLALHLTGHGRYTPLTRMLLGLLSDDELSATTSAISIYQLLVEAYRRGETDTAATAERYLTTIPGLSVVDVTPAIARQASQVRAQLGGSPERALQIATALSARAEVYLTQRSAFRRVAGMSVESLDLYSRA